MVAVCFGVVLSGRVEMSHASGQDDGEAVLWEPGEEHESRSVGGMVVCVVQSRADPTPGR
jgi:hypothetical protein